MTHLVYTSAKVAISTRTILFNKSPSTFKVVNASSCDKCISLPFILYTIQGEKQLDEISLQYLYARLI